MLINYCKHTLPCVHTHTSSQNLHQTIKLPHITEITNIPYTPHLETLLSRSNNHTYPGVDIIVCYPEDLFLDKSYCCIDRISNCFHHDE